MRVLVHGGAGVQPTGVDDQREDLSRALALGEAAETPRAAKIHRRPPTTRSGSSGRRQANTPG